MSSVENVVKYHQHWLKLLGLNNIYFIFFMKIQAYIHNRSLVLEEDLDDQAFKLIESISLHACKKYIQNYNMEIY